MTAVSLKNASDAYVAEKQPSKNYNAAARTYLADGAAANTRFGFIYFGVPSGMAGTTVTKAKLRLYSGVGFGGAVTLSIQRLSAKFSVNRVNWNNRPGVTGATKSLTKTSAANGTMWEFDVTDIMQQIANGSAWYGFRISATNSTTKWLYSAQGPDKYRPELAIEWSDAPDQPERLKPDDGVAVSVPAPTLVWDFVDHSGDKTMQSFDLKIYSTSALANANPDTTTGDLLDISLPNDVPQFDLDDPAAAAFPGISPGQTIYWRVRNVDGAGIRSKWSDVAYFTRTAKGTPNITNPAAAPNNFVTESTPPFSWTFAGATQEAYEVLLSTPEMPAKYLWRSGVVTSTENAVTPPPGKLTEVGKTYRVIVRIYDTVDRVSLPDDATYVEVFRDFTFDLSSSVAVVTGLTGTADTFRSRMILEWDDVTMPDAYVILRNNKQVAEVDPEDLLVAGTHYRYMDDDAKPRTNNTWAVARKVNNKVSSGNPTVVGKVKPITTTLSESDGDNTIYLFEPGVDADKASSSEVHYILGDAPPVLITQNLRGYEGTVTGQLLNYTVPGLSAATQLASLKGFRDTPGQILKLVWVDQVMKVVIYDVSYRPLPYPDGTVEYLVTFSFFQVDF